VTFPSESRTLVLYHFGVASRILIDGAIMNTMTRYTMIAAARTDTPEMTNTRVLALFIFLISNRSPPD
jgi:hypothetical protein